MSKVIVFGSMNMDLSIDAPRVPAAGETLSGSGFITVFSELRVCEAAAVRSISLFSP